MSNVEKHIRDLCWQDEQIGGIKFSEEEIQEILSDKHPFLLRIIRASIKQWKADNNEI
jgi:hypothetical protein